MANNSDGNIDATIFLNFFFYKDCIYFQYVVGSYESEYISVAMVIFPTTNHFAGDQF